MTQRAGHMSKQQPKPWARRLCCFSVIGLAFAAGRAEAQYDPGWTKNFRIGALTGLGVKGQIKLRGAFNANGSNPDTGIYDDGYVRTDDTGNAGGLTSFWGYESGSQYDAGTKSLQMHSASAFTAAGSTQLDQQFTAGLEVAYGNKLRQWGRTSLGWEFGFGYLPVTLKSASSGTFNGSVINRTYNFDATGIISMPGFPYNGGSSGIGALLGSTPTSITTNIVSGTVQETGTLEASFFTFRLGPTLFYDLSPHFGLAGGIGPAFGIVTETFHYNELISSGTGTPARTRGSLSATEVVYGAYLNVIATYHADENGDVYLGVQYMPMSGTTFSDGGREASLNLTGQFYFTLGVNWTF